MGELELEEEMACAFEDNDQNTDIDVALSHIDERVQNVLGQYRKDFEDGASSENLGAKFGGYGSFLPTYQRTPSILSHPRTPQTVQNHNIQIRSHDLPVEGAPQNSTFPSNVTQSMRPRPVGNSDKVQSSRECLSANEAGKLPESDKNTLKARIKVGSDNDMLAQQNAAIYNNLGLDMSPSSLSEDSPAEREGSFQDFQEKQGESPSLIIRIMTSLPIPNGAMLSPLPDSFAHFVEKRDLLQSIKSEPVQESSASSSTLRRGKEAKVQKDKNVLCDLRNEDGTEGYKSLPSYMEDCDLSKGMKDSSDRMVDPPRIRFKQKTPSILQDKMKEPVGEEQPFSEDKKKPKENQEHNNSASRKSKESLRVSFSAPPKDKQTHGSCFPSKSNGDDKSYKDYRKVKFSHSDQIGHAKLEKKQHRNDLAETSTRDQARDYKRQVPEKELLAFSNKSEERLGSRKSNFPSMSKGYQEGNLNDTTPSTDQLPVEVAPIVIQENWVCCDRCHKWRLLPYGANPDHLPRKWHCSMLDWLQGMNRCSFSEEETTKALNALYQVPVFDSNNKQQSHPDRTAFRVTLADVQHREQNAQHLSLSGVPDGGQKKLGTKTVSNAAQHNSSKGLLKSAVKNQHGPVKRKSLQIGNQSSLEIESEKRSGRFKISDSNDEQEGSHILKYEVENESHHFAPSKEESRVVNQGFNFKSDKVKTNYVGKNVSFRKCSNGSDRRENQSKYERNEDPQNKMDTFCRKDRKSTPTQFMLQNHDDEGSSNWLPSGRTDQVEVVSGRGKSLNSPPFGDKQGNFSGYSQSVPDSGEGGNYDVLPADGSRLAANNALKEAKDLKHFADNFKMSGSGLESTKLFFQAALKFLHGASLLDPCNRERAIYGDMTPTEHYTTTAKLFEYCACEFERCNDMASAALAYKCMEVAYMRVIYSNDVMAGIDRNELQMGLQMASPVASPSSSASDVDIETTVPKMDIDVGFPHPTGNHVIAARNQTNFVRLHDFAKDVSFAMEASRKSQIAFAAAYVDLAEKGNMEAISFVKKVVNFSFHDVDGLLRLVHLAMETLNR